MGILTRGTRRLSWRRLLLATTMVSGLGTGGFFGVHAWQASRPATSDKPWFASYVDVTATPSFDFEQLGTTAHKDVILSFVVSAKKGGCTPTWGAAYTLNQAGDTLDLDRRIERLRQQGGGVAVSFGGLKNDELAVTCSDPDKLYHAYASVVDRYQVDTIDLDLESEGLTDRAAGERRATAIAKLQTDRRAQGKHLAVWVTLPVTPQGLSEDGTDAVAALLAKGVDLAGVNVMTMDFGASRAGNQGELKASQDALVQTQRQLGVLYQRAGTYLNSATLWSKIGATPMIGQNDVAAEVFTVGDATGLDAFARDKGVMRMSMWSANRDIACGDNYVNLKIVSGSCSGVGQTAGAFASALGKGFGGRLSESSGNTTVADTDSTVQKPDDPKTSPYPIWSETGAYLKGTKVVWHHNVYQAKWWTQGDLPDNPVLQVWQTPWELIGPVLPGEKPVPQATLPPGMYPEWTGSATYETGKRVLFGGVPYQAKWWNQGQSPAAASSDPDDSPWVPLTQAQIDDLLAGRHTAEPTPSASGTGPAGPTPSPSADGTSEPSAGPTE